MQRAAVMTGRKFAERVTASAEAVMIVLSVLPARSFSRVPSTISAGGVSSMNWTNGSMASEYRMRFGTGIANSP